MTGYRLKDKINSIAEQATGKHRETIVDIFSRGVNEDKIKSYPVKNYIISFNTFFIGYMLQIIRFGLKVDDDEINIAWIQYWNGMGVDR